MTPYMWLVVLVSLSVLSVVVFGFIIARLIANRLFDRFNFECPNCQESYVIVCANCQTDRLQKGLGTISCKRCHSIIYNARCSCGYRIDSSQMTRLRSNHNKIYIAGGDWSSYEEDR